MNNDQLTPFAAVTFFSADDAFPIADEINCTELYELLQDRFVSNQSLYAIKVTGHFTTLKTRSVPAQEPPYPSLVEALQQQVEFDLDQVDATLAGFWLPAELADINVAGFHFHAITDLLTGGHVLECLAHGVEVEIDYINQLQIRFSDVERPHQPLSNPGHASKPHNWPSISHW